MIKMKLVRVVMLVVAMLIVQSCTKEIVTIEHPEQNDAIKTEIDLGMGESLSVISIDSCEYVLFQGYKAGGIVHKQNCKFCEVRKGETK